MLGHPPLFDELRSVGIETATSLVSAWTEDMYGSFGVAYALPMASFSAATATLTFYLLKYSADHSISIPYGRYALSAAREFGSRKNAGNQRSKIIASLSSCHAASCILRGVTVQCETEVLLAHGLLSVVDRLKTGREGRIGFGSDRI